MKYVPILFSTTMVQAIQAGRKTQTRRIIKSNIPDDAHLFHFLDSENLSINGGGQWLIDRKIDKTWSYFVEPQHGSYPCNDEDKLKPKTEIGDVFWVRETWLRLDKDHIIETPFVYKANGDLDTEEIRKDYIKSGRPYQWKPSIFMPKEACRTFLEVTNVRVERLHDISEEDAIAEGIEPRYNRNNFSHYKNYLNDGRTMLGARMSFFSLWESINGKESLASNPWLWVYDFKKIEKPNDFLI